MQRLWAESYFMQYVKFEFTFCHSYIVTSYQFGQLWLTVDVTVLNYSEASSCFHFCSGKPLLPDHVPKLISIQQWLALHGSHFLYWLPAEAFMGCENFTLAKWAKPHSMPPDLSGGEPPWAGLDGLYGPEWDEPASHASKAMGRPWQRSGISRVANASLETWVAPQRVWLRSCPPFQSNSLYWPHPRHWRNPKANPHLQEFGFALEDRQPHHSDLLESKSKCRFCSAATNSKQISLALLAFYPEWYDPIALLQHLWVKCEEKCQ